MKVSVLVLMVFCSFSLFAQKRSFSTKDEVAKVLVEQEWIMDKFLVLKYTKYPMAKKISRIDISTKELFQDEFSTDCEVQISFYINDLSTALQPITIKRGICPRFY